MDYTVGSAATLGVKVLGMQIDSSDNLYMLIGSTSSGSIGGRSGYLSYTVISPAAAHLSADLSIATDTGSSTDSGFRRGGLVIDATNPAHNYTYSFYRQAGTTNGLIHNSTTGSSIVATLTGITVPSDIGYFNNQIYAAAESQNIIRSYVTNFEGFGYSSGTSTFAPGVTGTYIWVNGYQQSVTTITPGQSLSYMWTLSGYQSNFTFYTGWGSSTATEPQDMHDLTELTNKPSPGNFPTSSNDVAGTYIYGFLLAKHKTTNLWYKVVNPVRLTISQIGAGYDSITVDNAYYNLTGDTVYAAFTYSSTSSLYFYQWMLCSRSDCADQDVWNGISLIGNPSTGHIDTDGMKEGNYYAVLMRHLPFLSNSIVAYTYLQIRPPVIGVSWDKPSYNLFPKTSVSSCLDATPAYFPWSNISGYAGLQTGWFSCSVTPADANANNSIMRGFLFARYNGTFYLNNSLGNVWNGTLYNGSGALIYTLTNSSVTETWSLVGVNQSGETFYATTEVKSESLISYSISVSPSTAYNMDTLYLTFSRPIWRVTDYVIIKDAGGTTITTFSPSAKSGTYYIDPTKSYTYGTWTAYWDFGSIDPIEAQNAVYTFRVINAGRPTTNASTDPENSAEYTSSEITGLLSSKIFWALLFIIGIMIAMGVKERRGK